MQGIAFALPFSAPPLLYRAGPFAALPLLIVAVQRVAFAVLLNSCRYAALPLL
jgi:hypothetical protein